MRRDLPHPFPSPGRIGIRSHQIEHIVYRIVAAFTAARRIDAPFMKQMIDFLMTVL